MVVMSFGEGVVVVVVSPHCRLLNELSPGAPLPLLPPCRWNQLDLAIVLLSIMGITLEEIEMNAALPINPTIIRIMRVLRIARGEGLL